MADRGGVGEPECPAERRGRSRQRRCSAGGSPSSRPCPGSTWPVTSSSTPARTAAAWPSSRGTGQRGAELSGGAHHVARLERLRRRVRLRRAERPGRADRARPRARAGPDRHHHGARPRPPRPQHRRRQPRRRPARRGPCRRRRRPSRAAGLAARWRCRCSSKPSPTTGSRCASGSCPMSDATLPAELADVLAVDAAALRAHRLGPASASSRPASCRSPSPACSPRSWPPPGCSSATTST